MTTPTPGAAWQRAVIIMASTVVASAVIFAMYWMKDVLIPIALAVYLSFVLGPVVRLFERRGLQRIPSVIIVVLLMGLTLGGMGFIATRQVHGLLNELPKYRTTIIERVRTIRDWKVTPGALGTLIGDINQEMAAPEAETSGQQSPSAPQATPTRDTPATPTPVATAPPPQPRWVSAVTTWATEAMSYAGKIFLALILVIFILIKREDLRNRFIWLVGRRTLTSTTKAVEDAATRVSRFLLTQLLVNIGFGIVLGVGLWLMGVKYALLWGFLGAGLKYLPYIGAWVAAVFPVVVSLAMSNGWGQPIAVLAFIATVELINGNAIEPYVFGRTIGVSEVALLIGATFWTWLWGPIGLILSPPLTVVLVVLGKHVSYLEFLAVLLGDEPSLSPTAAYYQRLLARDQDEASKLVLKRLEQPEPDKVYDEYMIPALCTARRGRERNEITRNDEEFVWETTREILDDLGEASAPAEEEGQEVPPPPPEPGLRRIRLLALPARDEADLLALQMLAQLLPESDWEVMFASPQRLAVEIADQVADTDPDLICVGAVSGGGLARSRYLCKRIRSLSPGTKIFVGRWFPEDEDSELPARLEDVGADAVEGTLIGLKNRLLALKPVFQTGQRIAAEVHEFSRLDLEDKPAGKQPAALEVHSPDQRVKPT
ncbi:AI-2E family transporter [Planctomicrobium sp. SH664]|uniref:AI-2E family transporter n=1 Tax=Planctomicrobium sp. SH664 TaxID=3448125 RepID=UPI003F5BB2A6